MVTKVKVWMLWFKHSLLVCKQSYNQTDLCGDMTALPLIILTAFDHETAEILERRFVADLTARSLETVFQHIS